ncbi:NAD(P)-dependent dehydrogenase (short-subunit alcohol dehydrogenase family) [Neorhizobium sp. R1-B]|jgi:NAD(P)-dependent dehydrogenase (short-subunit alcohol dehydrogenase family)|uniref:SDR family oxidoreductase n=1 Tax=Neorhizobium TaxID=1525371 RepID=UPI000CF94B5C|nr:MULTISPECIES: SDR family oxidoreductase [Neorhizobium]TCV58829.1 NAD(P)-dependent dehydrogenase (short-subunit alcohol dehydrogenase family) [Neorhizobium sp. S3-V5DH]TDX70213.1 NAD(P)-dependent dehydrogenase (short-subunit alcohol dehydrogenase family) [Neorhizobium sp. R1-B]
MTKWTTSNIPSQHGVSVVVTGTGGLGYEDALALARAGADVVIAGRNPQKGVKAVASIRQAVPGAMVRFGQVDLADLASIAGFAAKLAQEQDSLDLLINNAGVMRPPVRRETKDGFELQFGTNYLGHFALTAYLLPLLKKGLNPRVVTLSSVAARGGAIDFDDLQAERSYKPMQVYSQSKLACIMFAFEMSRRSKAAGWGVESLAAHPGLTRTDLIVNGSGRWSLPGMLRRFMPFLFQPACQGALPTLYAATDPAARDGAYYGPDRLGGTRGYPVKETPPKQALDTVAAARLWDISLALTGATFA